MVVIRTILVALIAAWAAQVLAHGMDILLAPDNDQIRGQVVYSDGRPGVGDFISIANLTDLQAAPLEATTDAEGRFAVTGILGHQYVVTAHGEEGHTVETTLVLGEAAAATEDGSIPFFVIAGALLLFSVIPARYLSRKAASS